MNIYLLLFLIFIMAPIGTIIHESGHLIGAILMKADRLQMSIGYGKKLFTIEWKNIKIKMCSFFFIGGHMYNERDIPYKPFEMICIIGFGPLLNSFFAILFFGLYQLNASEYFKLLSLFNLWLALVNTIPFKVKDKQSDGYMVLKLLQKQKREL